eukprot:3376341-Rhodomonas_salina.1
MYLNSPWIASSTALFLSLSLPSSLPLCSLSTSVRVQRLSSDRRRGGGGEEEWRRGGGEERRGGGEGGRESKSSKMPDP